MIHVSLSQCVPNPIPTPQAHPKHRAPLTDRDRKLEGRAHLAVSQGIHVPLIGQRHFPEAAAQIDQAEGAWFTGRVA